ncbi:MAG TPA: protein-methionine-sulfoxide reductase heme-binding subunit MsrQ [Anaerolineaceae bacterium]|nr:protein-methionine-sulfoxide reductase heme-binding subunit MsrQ [Anaerolineaceae bacterium]HQH86019.1 protein-methionine-sulfoxide reductase heme-binding subunit MsrQ [Anaerolineaceae bacterium]
MRLKFTRFQGLVHLAAFAPLAVLIIQAIADRLTANPIQAITQRTGQAAVIGLLLTLACTPINTITGWRAVLTVRRALGLWAGFYALLHFLTFAMLDYGLDLRQIGRAILEKPFILVGLITLLVLIPLAITSTRAAMRKMGARWKKLHRLSYLAAVLAVIHYLLAAKADFAAQPLIYGSILGLLMVLRIKPVRQWFIRRRASAATAED